MRKGVDRTTLIDDEARGKLNLHVVSSRWRDVLVYLAQSKVAVDKSGLCLDFQSVLACT